MQMKTRMRWMLLVAAVVVLSGWGKSDLQAGKDYFQAGEYEKAVDSFTKAIQSNPKDQEAYFFRGATLSAVEQFDQAVRDYTKALEINPKYADAYWSRGYCYANARKYAEAIADYTKSLELGTNMGALVHGLRAKVYFQKSRLDEAEADLKAVLQLTPNDPEALQGLEEIKKARANPSFNPDALELRPINEQPQYGGRPPTVEEQRANDQFIQEVTQAYGTKEQAFRETLKRAWAHYQQGEYTTAMRRFNQAWLLEKTDPEIFYGYSKILRALRYSKEAADWERKAKEGGYVPKE